MKARSALTAFLLSATAVLAAFDSHTLVLQQGAEPTIDGGGLGGTYTGAVDTCVDRHYPTQAFYTNDVVRFGLNDGTDGAWVGNGDDRTRGYLRFENFETYLPQRAVVTRARLVLKSAGTDGGTNYNAYIGYRTASFGTNITWNTAGAKTDNVITIGNVCSWALRWPLDNVQVVDVTSLVRAWASSALANHGWQFTGVEDSGWDGTGYLFYSGDHSSPANRPRLEVDYVIGGDLTYSNKVYRRGLVATNGAPVLQDTFIDSRAANSNNNYSGSSSCTIEAWTESLRGLFKITMANPLLTNITTIGQLPDSTHPQLKGAYLQLQSGGLQMSAVMRLWKVAEDWDVATATYAKKNASTAWANVWALSGQLINNVNPTAPVATANSGAYITSLTMTFDITSLMQSYVEGTNNYGLVVGNENWYGYSDNLRFTEDANALFRPTLVMELWYLDKKGTLILVQ